MVPRILLVLAALLFFVGPFVLLFGLISGGVTARKIGWGVLGLALLGAAAFCSFLCAFGYESVSTGLNPRPWWMSFGTLVIALLGYVFSGAKLFRKREGQPLWLVIPDWAKMVAVGLMVGLLVSSVLILFLWLFAGLK